MGPYTRHTRHNSIEYEHILVYHVGIKISCSTCTSIMAIQSTNTHTHTTSPLHHSTACPITACPITHPHPRAKTQHRCWRHRRRSRYFRLVGGLVIGHVVIEEVHSTDHDSRSSQGVHTPCVHARARTPRVRPTTDDRRRRRRASARTTTCGRRVDDDDDDDDVTTRRHTTRDVAHRHTRVIPHTTVRRTARLVID